MLIPGFMAGDPSLSVLRGWLRRRGHRVRMSGIRTNVGCAEAIVDKLSLRLGEFAERAGEPVFLIGQSRGGALARALAVRHPDSVAGLVMLGSPVADSLAVSTHVLRTVRWVAALGDAGVPGVFTSTCKDGACCAEFRAELAAPIPAGIRATAVYSRSDGIVDWRACVDPLADAVEVSSSHCGMSVNLDVYNVLDRALDAGRSTRMEWMSPIDSSFLHIENATTPMHIGGVSIFEGPPPPFEQLRAMVEGKLGIVPRYRQKVRFVPLAAGPPVWVDDPHFSLDYHLRHTAIPAPGGELELRQMAARVFSQPLDRDKPLWEMWMVEGMRDGRWALLSKVHHCMVDGVAATDLMSVMFSDETAIGDASPSAMRAPGLPSPSRAASRCCCARSCDGPAPPGRSKRSTGAARRRAKRCTRVTEVARAAAAAGPSLRPVAASSLNGPIGPHRRWSWAEVRLTDVKAVRAVLGGTVNDVVLTVITNGFRELLESRGEHVAGDRVVRTMVPVSVRRRGEKGVYNNRVSAVFAGLPVGLDDPVERLQRIRAEMDGVKESKQAVAGDVLTSHVGLRPAAAAGPRQPPGDGLAAPEHAHRDDQRARPPAAGADARAADVAVLPLRARRGLDPHRRGDLLLRRRPVLRRDRRLRRRARRRRADRRYRAWDGRVAGARRQGAARLLERHERRRRTRQGQATGGVEALGGG